MTDWCTHTDHHIYRSTLPEPLNVFIQHEYIHRDRQLNLSGEKREVNQLHSPDCREEGILFRIWSLLVRLESFPTPLHCLSFYYSLFLAFCVFLSLLLVFSHLLFSLLYLFSLSFFSPFLLCHILSTSSPCGQTAHLL